MGDEEIKLIRNTYGIETYATMVRRQESERRNLIRRALHKANSDNPNGPVVYAARLLGIERSRMTRFMKKYKINKQGLYD